MARSPGTSSRIRAPCPASGSRKRRDPPCSWATHRATASPRPVPPAPSVPNRSKTRSRSSGATPPPESTTSSHHEPPVGPSSAPRSAPLSAPAVMRTDVSAGAWRAALSTTLTSSWRSRAGSPATTRSSATSIATSRVRPVARTWATTSSTSACSATSWRSRSTTPASSRESWSRSSTSRPRRCASSSAAPRCWESAGTTPSARFSSRAVMAVSGVRSSWETVAIRSRRSRSTLARSSAIRLKAVASWPTSSVADVRTRPV